MSSAVRRRRPALITTLVAIAAAAAVMAGGSAAAFAAMPAKLPPPPPTPKDGAAIEGLAPYQAQFFCRHKVEPGVKAFEKLVLATYPDTASDGDMRACADGGTSEHKDGRAWDWGADHRNAKQRADGRSLLKWLFAKDANGNKDAMFRRLGLMYVIWNKRIWGTWSQKWEPYSCSGVTACHVNHIHFSFGWAGAEKKTSFWTDKVSPVVEPPLPHLSALQAHRTLRVVASQGSKEALWLLKGNDTYRAVASGVWQRGAVKADSVCTKTSDGWVPSHQGGVSVGGDQLQSWGEHWVPTHDNGKGCNPTTHAYRLVIAPSSSSTVIAQLPGAGHSKDAGSIKVRFTRTA
jgi:hypothetical protein